MPEVSDSLHALLIKCLCPASLCTEERARLDRGACDIPACRRSAAKMLLQEPHADPDRTAPPAPPRRSKCTSSANAAIVHANKLT